MTTATFRYIDPNSYDHDATEPFKKPWNKVDVPTFSYKLSSHEHSVKNLRGLESGFSIDNAGFAVYREPSTVTTFTDDGQIRGGYYREVERLLRKHLPGIKKVVIFDHTIRQRVKGSVRGPSLLVHVDQTPRAAEMRVHRHLSKDDAKSLLHGRYQIINVWRPIQHPASDYPLAVIDWRSTQPSDFVKVDLLYPKNWDQLGDVAPEPASLDSTKGYEVRGEQYAIAFNEKHCFYYLKDMSPDEVIFIKCYDSKSASMTDDRTAIAHAACHSAFCDPQTPADAPGRQSIEVRCLVFYD